MTLLLALLGLAEPLPFTTPLGVVEQITPTK